MNDFQDDEEKLYADMKADLEADGVDMSDVDVPGGTGSREDGPPVGSGPYGGNADEAESGGGDDDDEVYRAAILADEYIQQQRDGALQESPSLEDDPISYFETRINALEQQRSGEQMLRAVQESEAAIQAEAPDYTEACEHLEKSRRAELARMLPDNSPQAHLAARQAGFRSPAEAREAQLEADRVAVVRAALQSGQSPARAYYDLAVSRGWQSRGGGVRGSRAAGHGKLLDLYETDPDSFDREWDRLANSGKL